MNALSSYHQGTRHSDGWFETAGKVRGPGTEEALAVLKLSVMLLLILLYYHHYSYHCYYCNRKEPQGGRSCPRKEEIELELSGLDCRISFFFYTLELAGLTAIYSPHLVSQK